jgi:hypothetical protein
MIVMLDTSGSLETAASELGCEVEQLLTPLTCRRIQAPGKHFAVDNGAFSQLEIKGFLSLLKRLEPEKHLCRWVAVPDIVGSARRTLEVWSRWKDRINYPLAFVCQDGQENFDLPWDECSAIFIGGTTEWKMSNHVVHIIKTAKALEKWIHVGRVNTPGRFEYFEELEVDSLDGTGLGRYTHMRKAIYEERNQPKLL